MAEANTEDKGNDPGTNSDDVKKNEVEQRVDNGVKKPDEGGSVISDKAIAEQEVKQAFLKRFRQKKDASSVKEVKKTEDVNNDEVAKKLYRDITKTQSREFIVLRMRKQTLLFVGGVLLVMMWLFPLIRWFVTTGYSRPATQNKSEEVEMENLPTAIPVEEVDERISDTGVMIRIRDNGGEGMAESLQTYLLSRGYLQVELIDDHGSQYSGLGVVVKPDALELRAEVESIISDKYGVASPSAELTEDSEVDVLVLFGLQEE